MSGQSGWYHISCIDKVEVLIITKETKYLLTDQILSPGIEVYNFETNGSGVKVSKKALDKLLALPKEELVRCATGTINLTGFKFAIGQMSEADIAPHLFHTKKEIRKASEKRLKDLRKVSSNDP